MSHKLVSLYIGDGEYYTRTDADNVIAEKDAEIARLDDLAHAHNIELLRKENLIAELKEERRWRKCSDELPDDGAEVLATDGDGIWLCYKTTMSDGSPWFQPDGLPHIEGVTHWMPLPAEPKEEKNA